MKQEPLMEEPIIESSGALSFLVRLRDIILTILMWLMYIYFMRNFFFFMGDFFSWAFHGFGDTSPYESFKIVDTLFQYFEVILVMGLLFIAWAVYNKLRFGKKTRRLQTLPIETEHVASAYGLKQEDLSLWQESRVLMMHHEANGRLSNVEVLT